MTHHNEEHHQHHKKEREHEKALQKQHEDQEMRSPRSIHPLWFVALGAVMIAGVLFVWLFLWT